MSNAKTAKDEQFIAGNNGAFCWLYISLPSFRKKRMKQKAEGKKHKEKVEHLKLSVFCPFKIKQIIGK